MNKSKAPALGKGLDIIDLIRKNDSLSFLELQELTADNPASLSRYLHTLIEKNYIIKNSSQKYELGLKLIDLKNNKSLWPRLIIHSRPILEQLNKKYKVSLILLAYNSDTYVAIDKVIAYDNLGMMEKHTVGPNDINSIWSNFYYQNKENLPNLHLQNINNENKLDMDNIKRAIDLCELVQNQGFITYSSHGNTIFRIGIPIYYQNQVIASLGIGTFIHQLGDETKQLLIQDALSLSKKLSTIL